MTIKAWVLAMIMGALASATPVQAGERGAVTNLPLPRFVSMKAEEGNARRGPSMTHRIDWVYKRKHMPLKVIAEHGHWRRVVDRDGLGGWVHYSLLSGVRTVIVEEDGLPIYSRPALDAQVAAKLELGVVAFLSQCRDGWCQLESGGYRGWTQSEALWGLALASLND